MLYSTSFYQYGIKVCDFVANTGKDSVSKKICNVVGYFTKRGHCARLPEDFEKVYFNVLSKVLENALITLWSAAENFRSILGDIIN